MYKFALGFILASMLLFSASQFRIARKRRGVRSHVVKKPVLTRPSRGICVKDFLPFIHENCKPSGQGSVSEVCVADTTCAQSNVELACKRLREKRFESKPLEGDYSKLPEVHYGKILDHPYVIRFYGVGMADDSTTAIMMEAATGGDLKEHVAVGSWALMSSKAQAKAILQMLVALRHVHYKECVHSDLQPAHFIFHKKYQQEDDVIVKLADFGLACTPGDTHFNCAGEAGARDYFPHYFDPEVLTAGRTKASDMWSMGIMLYELTRGEKPWFLRHVSDKASVDPKAILRLVHEVRAENRANNQNRSLHLDNLQGQEHRKGIDDIIQGCFKEQQNRITATDAVNFAKEYAKMQELKDEEIKKIANPKQWLVEEFREQLPPKSECNFDELPKHCHFQRAATADTRKQKASQTRIMHFFSSGEETAKVISEWQSSSLAHRTYKIVYEARTLTIQVYKNAKEKSTPGTFVHKGGCMEAKVNYTSSRYVKLLPKRKAFPLKVRMCLTNKPDKIEVQETPLNGQPNHEYRKLITGEGAFFERKQINARPEGKRVWKLVGNVLDAVNPINVFDAAYLIAHLVEFIPL